MNSTILSHNRARPSDELYCMFYVRADNCDGENFDLVVIAEGERQAVEIWAQHYYPDEVSMHDESSFVVERWSEEGNGIMMLADHGDLDQIGLQPGPIHWAVTPFNYASSQASV